MLSEVITFFDGKLGQGKCFSEAATALLVSVIPALKELSARGELSISKEVISHYTLYPEFCSLAENKFISPESNSAIQGFVNSRACFDSSMQFNNQSVEFIRSWDMTRKCLVEALQSINEDKWIE